MYLGFELKEFHSCMLECTDNLLYRLKAGLPVVSINLGLIVQYVREIEFMYLLHHLVANKIWMDSKWGWYHSQHLMLISLPMLNYVIPLSFLNKV